ncbi:hypothetical protein CRM78_11455 [Yersinia pseudotuberculosis]|nr:hypothetical protein CRM78_11455 [Yersinia pseudotuberculosis]
MLPIFAKNISAAYQAIKSVMTVNHIGLSATKKGPVGPFRSVRTDWNYSTSMAFSSLNASSRRVIIVTWAARNHTRGS